MTKAFLTLLGCLSLFCGCQSGQTQKACAARLTDLQKENLQLTRELEKSNAGAELLQKQLEITRSEKVDKNYSLDQVKITRYTNLYDKNNDGKKETLIVYIKPVDNSGDLVKAQASVEVELWDLDQSKKGPLLASWKIDAPELAKLWFATVLTQNYRLTFDVSNLLDKSPKSLTVKINFTDHNTGRIFSDQRVIKP